MENQKEEAKQEEHECCGSGHGLGKHCGKHGHCFIKLFAVLAVLSLAFCIGLAFGRCGSYKHGFDYSRKGGYGMMDGRFYGGKSINDDFRRCAGALNAGVATTTGDTATGTTTTK